MDKTYKIPTKLGAVTVHPVTATQLYITFENLNVFTIAQSGSLRLGLTDGNWGKYTGNGDPNGFHALNVNSRWDGTKHVESSHAADRKIETVLTEAVSAWVKANPDVLTEAGRADLDKQIVKASAAVEAAQKHLADAKATLFSLIALRGTK